MAAYVEKYEITGKEQDVAEWWKLADKAAIDTNCIMSEDYGGSDIGDIIHAMDVLKRLTSFVSYASASDDKPIIIVKEGTFLAIPGAEKVIPQESTYYTWETHIKEYGGIEFHFSNEYKEKEESKELEGAA